MATLLRAPSMLTRPRVQSVEVAPLRYGPWDVVQSIHEGAICRSLRVRPHGLPATRLAHYVLKTLLPRWANVPAAQETLAREAAASKAARSPHVIAVLDAALESSPRYLVTPWLEGCTAAKLVASGPLDVATALGILRQTAEALEALSQAGWRHGDLSPANIHVDPRGHVTLLDLGAARRLDEPARDAGSCLIGSLGYLAPEAFVASGAMDIRSDLYSLGIIAFELLTGARPFDASTPGELARQHREQPLPNIQRRNILVARELDQWLRQLTAKIPERRPSAPRFVVDALLDFEIDALASD